MYTIIEIILAILFSTLTLKKVKITKKNLAQHKLEIIIFLIVFLGCLSRLLLIQIYPIGLNQDEASIGYEAYSLMKYGIDRNGQTWPIHLIAWGSGQNALYAYLLIPFIRIFNLNTFSVRLPMALIGCLSLLIFTNFTKDLTSSPKNRLLLIVLFAINPWHIMKSRWGLESNLFPDLLFYAAIFLYYGLKKDSHYLYLSSIIIGLSCYSYGTSYLYIPILFFLVYGYYLLKKKITIHKTIQNLALIFIIAFPMILFCIINFFELDTIRIFNTTIPKLDYNRFTSITSINGNFFTNSLKNILSSLKIIVTGADSQVLNHIKIIGLFYPFTIIFIIYGIYKSFRNYSKYALLNSYFLSGLCISLFVTPNINRLNILWLPLLFYSFIGLINILNHFPQIYKFILSLYIFSFIIFTTIYFTTYQKNIGNKTFNGLVAAINFTQNLEYNSLYITDDVNSPYIYYLYTTKYNPHDYLKKRQLVSRNVMFQKIISIDNVYFTNPDSFLTTAVYILEKDSLSTYQIPEYMSQKVFNNYVVIYYNTI